MQQAKGTKGRADRYFSLAVRTIGRCESCNRRDNLQCAHIIGRKYSQTRCSFRNALCLCASCHAIYTDNPIDFARFVSEHALGEYTDKERIKAYSTVNTKIDWLERIEKAKQVTQGLISIYDARLLDL